MDWQPKETIIFNSPILVTDGKLITICVLNKWKRESYSGISLLGHGFGGCEWGFDITFDDITDWMPLPALPAPRN